MIPFNKPFIVGKELFYISQAVLEGNLAGDGRFTRMCNRWMEEQFGAKKILLTHSCTAALEISAILADIQPGDEIIMPSFTFVSTANAFVLRGAALKFIDIRPDTLNMDEQKIEDAITEKTRAIVPVHYAGVGCEMDTIMDIAEKHRLVVIEDAAQGVNATYNGRFLGTIGDIGCYSFHETKNFISGEGGALAINREDFVDRAEIIREKGTNRSRFFKGQIDKYTWVDIGSSYLPSEIIAAFLYAQLEEAEAITHKRAAIYSRYMTALRPLAERELIKLPYIPRQCRHNAHMFYIILNSLEERDQLLAFLKKRDIYAVFHYVPLHLSPMGLKIGKACGNLTNTEMLSERLIRLPCYYELTKQDQDVIIDSIFTFFTTSDFMAY